LLDEETGQRTTSRAKFEPPWQAAVPTYDAEGEPILDATGQPVTSRATLRESRFEDMEGLMLLIREINSALLLGILSLAMIGCSGGAAEPLAQPTIPDATSTITSPQPTRQVTPKVSVPTHSPSTTQVIGASPPAQPAPSEVLFNPKEYPVECVDPILGSKNADDDAH